MISDLRISEIMASNIHQISLQYLGKNISTPVEKEIQLPWNKLSLPPQAPLVFFSSQFTPLINSEDVLIGVARSRELREAMTRKTELITIYPYSLAPFVPPNSTFKELTKLMEKDEKYTLSNILVVSYESKLIGYLPPRFLKILASPQLAFLFLQAVDNIREGIIMIDNQTRILYANPAYSRILGVPTYRIIGKFLSDIEPHALILKTISTGQPFLNQPVKIQSLNKDVVVNISPVSTGNKILGAVSVFQDVTQVTDLYSKLAQYQKLAQQLYSDLAQNNFPSLSLAFRELVATHPDFLRCLHLADRIAPTDAPVLITGESGTGKELLARAIHQASPRHSGPFIEINCASVPETLIESELFGYEDGAFTGAKKGGKPGKFHLAHGGTLFLDEIGEMSLAMQAKLLRALQSGTIHPLGSLTACHIDVRIIAATNRDLCQLVNAGTFRMDLFYRINVFHIHLPPLRERGTDILLLAQHFLEKFCHKYNSRLSFSPEAIEVLKNYPWPGNVRELENAIHHAVVLAREDEYILPSHLPQNIKSYSSSRIHSPFPTDKRKLNLSLEETEKEEILKALRASRTCTEAMKYLGISRRTFYRKLKKHNINPRIELKK